MQTPFFQQIADSRSILIAGAGGGFDIVSGVPIYLYLRRLGKEVTLANLSFTALPFAECEEVCPGTYRVTDESAELPYFPERHILDWLRARGDSPAIYAFSNELGVRPLSHAYECLIERHGVDTLILVDGGTDSLMFGDEAKVGTIVEDAASIVAAGKTSVRKRLLAAIGFGVEHDLNHHACLENMAALAKDGHYLGAVSLTGNMAEGQGYLELVDYLNARMPLHASIVTNSIASAMRGEFGDYHATRRTKGTVQFVSPLMNLYWLFQLEGIAQRIEFAAAIEPTETMDEVAKAFQRYRIAATRRIPQGIPLK